MAEASESIQSFSATFDDAADWRPHVESLRSDPDIAPHLDKISERNIPDLVKSHVHLSRQLGSAISIPGANAKPEEIKAFKDSVYKAGVFKAPPADPNGYNIARPETIPEAMWNEELVTGFRSLAHKHGLTEEAVKELLEFDAQRFGGKPAWVKDHDELKKTITEQWAKDGKTYDDMMNFAAEAQKQFSAGEWSAMEAAGLTDNPAVLSALAKIGEAFKMSDGQVGSEAAASPNAALEANDIVRNKANPKYEAYHRGDPEVTAYVEGLFKKAHPGTVEI